MNIRSYLFAAASLLITTITFSNAFAQDETDALRFSQTNPQGTARSMGFGGALGAIGGDFSSLSVNPAGIGVYRRSEFTFTPSLKINNTNSTYQGNAMEDNSTRFTVNNLGVVFTSAAQGQRYERSKWKSVSFGFGINRMADFNNNYTYKGLNNTSSGAELYSIDANKYPGDVNDANAAGTLAYMGYQSFLLDTFNGAFVPVVDYRNGTYQQRSVIQKGGITDFNISLGGNYDEKLMLGATLGIPSIRYKREVTYQETDATGNPNNYFDNFSYKENLTTKGSGINLKLGFIYKPADFIRIGLALHTPTYFNLKDVQNRSLSTSTENFKSDLGIGGSSFTKIDAPENVFEYNLLTPWRANVSAAGIFNKYGFLSVDYEYVDYASARFNFDANSREYQASVNQGIKSSYKGASIVRVGAEGRIQQLALRLGFGYYGSPYKNTAIKGERTDVSAGVGFRSDNWFLDLAVVHSISEQQEQPYTFDPSTPGYANVIVPTAITKNNLNNIALTLGFKF